MALADAAEPVEKSHAIAIALTMSASAKLIKHSMRIAGHATSFSLEEPFWQALCEIAERRGQPVSALVAVIDAQRSGNLSSAIRVFVLESCRRGELCGRRDLSGLPTCTA
jgi:predicted DNA-binding ribbon-helix-helix protein